MDFAAKDEAADAQESGDAAEPKEAACCRMTRE